MTPSPSKTRFSRPLLWIGILLGGLAFASVVLMNMLRMNMGDSAEELDYATTRLSNNGTFNVSYTLSTGEVPINQMHQWTLHVETADGQPVTEATISVDGDMPQHGHGLPTRPEVTQNLGDGDYLVEGLRFQMGGWWVMDFTITADGQSDTVRFNMLLQP